jgi:hypothetical protein
MHLCANWHLYATMMTEKNLLTCACHVNVNASDHEILNAQLQFHAIEFLVGSKYWKHFTIDYY